MIRAVPSWSFALSEVVRVGVQLTFTHSLTSQARFNASVSAVSEAGVWLAVATDVTTQANLRSGDAIVLGIAKSDMAMLYVYDVLVKEVLPTRILVSSPGTARKAPRRSAARVPLDWRCQVVCPHASFETETLNVSATGALIAPPATRIGWQFSSGDEFVFHLDVPSRMRMVMRAKVVRVDNAGAVAVHYLDLPEIEEVGLQLLVLRAMARRYVRIKTVLPCALVRQGKPLPGRTDNISGAGALMRFAQPFDVSVGEFVEVAITLTAASTMTLPPPIYLHPAVITRVERDGADMLVAIDYSDASRDARNALTEFVMGNLRNV